MIDFTQLAEAVIALIFTAITAFLIPWLKQKYGNEALEKTKSWVQIAVYAAEKMYGAGKGDEKLKYVENFLASHKIKLDTDALKALVDAEVKKMEIYDPPVLIQKTEVEVIDPPEGADMNAV